MDVLVIRVNARLSVKERERLYDDICNIIKKNQILVLDKMFDVYTADINNIVVDDGNERKKARRDELLKKMQEVNEERREKFQDVEAKPKHCITCVNADFYSDREGREPGQAWCDKKCKFVLPDDISCELYESI